MASEEEKPHSSELNSQQFAVSLKLPPYWPNDPRVWFAQVEAQFATRGITQQQTRYAYVVSSLQPEIALEVRDLLLQSPSDQPYDKLKEELIKRTSASEQRRLHQLLTAEELGDRKPTQLLRRMRQLLGDHTLEESILKQLFLQRLPTNTQLILAPTSDTVSVDQLAIVADKISEVTPSAGQISAVAPAKSTESADSCEVSELKKMIEQLTRKVEVLESRWSSKPRSRSSSRSNRGRDNKNRERSSHSPAPTPHEGEHCWYHWRYGDKANKCNQPCTYQKQENDDANN